MKIIELYNAQQALLKISKIEMNIKKSYELKKFILKSREKLEAFNEIRSDLIKKYWEEKDWNIFVKNENINSFYSDLSIVWEEEINIEIPTISIEDLEWNIDTETLIQLDFLIR